MVVTSRLPLPDSEYREQSQLVPWRVTPKTTTVLTRTLARTLASTRESNISIDETIAEQRNKARSRTPDPQKRTTN